MNQETEAIEPEIVEPEPQTAITRRRPDVPTTVDELASLQAEGHEIIQAREQILQTLRSASIRATHPSDWLLFRAIDDVSNEERITGFLQDSGCERVRALWGISIIPTDAFERIEAPDGQFAYRTCGRGTCAITGEEVLEVEGIRYSTEDFVKYVDNPIQKEMRVRQAATANRNGNIVRSLAGLKQVPIQELESAWKGTSKKIGQCSHGRGYGSQAERRGAQVQEASHVPVGQEPICEICQSKARFVKAGVTRQGKSYSAFWSCPNKDHKWTIRDDEWKKLNQSQAPSDDDRAPGEEG